MLIFLYEEKKVLYDVGVPLYTIANGVSMM
jgi:hypothetical protein